MVVGSDDGQVRLYSEKSLTRANTAIPGLGAPITSVDVTYDGKWVLATTNKYLMVVKTVFKVSMRAYRSRLSSLGLAVRQQSFLTLSVQLIFAFLYTAQGLQTLGTIE